MTIILYFVYLQHVPICLSYNIVIFLQEDLYYPHPLIQDLMWDSIYMCGEPFLTRWPLNKTLRKRALEVTMKHIHYEDENSRYITIGCVEKVYFFLLVYQHTRNFFPPLKSISNISLMSLQLKPSTVRVCLLR